MGAGTGTVTSTPAGIQCGTTCSFLAGQDGTMVTLHAQTANNLSSLFTGWSGGGCSGLARDCTVTLLASTTVAAIFVPLTANLIFLTSTYVAPNLGSATAYDAVCNATATAAGINDAGGDAYTAVTSDAATTVRSRLGASANGWVRMDAEPFADTQATLFAPNDANRVFNTVRFNDLGQTVSGDGFLSMTGTFDDGTTASSTCNNWTSSSAALTVSAGSSAAGPGFWVVSGGVPCSLSWPIMCMGHTRNVTVSPHVVTGRKIWLYNGFLSIVAGQSLDALCQASRPTGVMMAVALVAHPSVAGSSLIDPTQNYVRVDGTLVGTGMQLQTNSDLMSGIWQEGNGQYGIFSVWTGSTTMQTVGTTVSTCGDWVDSTNTNPAIMGRSWSTGSWWSGGSGNCQNNEGGVYCVQTAP
jgi:hypothetical protein